MLVLHTCSHLPDGFPRVPTDTPLFQCLRPRCYRYRLHHIMARRLWLPDRLGQRRILCGKRLEEQRHFVREVCLGTCEQMQVGSGCMDTGHHHMVRIMYALSSINNAHPGFSLLFAVTAAFSIYGVSYYRKNGSSPEYSVRDAEHLPIEDHDFSADTSDKFNDHENLQLNHADGDEARFGRTIAEERTHPSGPIAWNLQQQQLQQQPPPPHTAPAELGFEPFDTTYRGSGQPYEYSQQSQTLPPYQYPANNSRYDTGRSNESQGVGELPTQSGGGPSRHDLALEYDHGGYGTGGKVNFPEGDYGR